MKKRILFSCLAAALLVMQVGCWHTPEPGSLLTQGEIPCGSSEMIWTNEYSEAVEVTINVTGGCFKPSQLIEIFPGDRPGATVSIEQGSSGSITVHPKCRLRLDCGSAGDSRCSYTLQAK